MLKACFRTPKNQEEGRWMTIAEIFKVLQEQYPMLIADHRTKIRIGQAMKFLNCERKRTNKGLPIISVQKWRKHAEKYVENHFKKGLVAAKRVVWCSVSVVSTPTLHTTKLINNQQFKYH